MSLDWDYPKSGLTILKLGIGIFLLVVLAACTDDPAVEESAETTNPSVTVSELSELGGGDPVSWLSGAGDNADSNFCKGVLKLPFAKEPAWEFVYTDAVFSSEPPEEIVHYDGVLAISAYTSQLLGLDATTGELLFNQSAYNPGEPTQGNRRIQVLYLHPAGLLSARDESGKIFCWDVTESQLTRKWVYKGNAGIGGIVASNGSFFALGGKSIVKLDANSGAEVSQYPALQSRASVVLSDSGLLISYGLNGHKLVAHDSKDGVTRWISFFDHQIDAIVIANAANCVFVMTADEVLSCLNLDTGEVLWDYSWAWLMDEETRDVHKQQNNFPQVRILPRGPIAVPQGFCMPLTSGDVLMFDHAGEINWHYQADSSIVAAIGFENAIVVKQFWESTEEFPRWRYDPFNQTTPDWDEVNKAVETRGKDEVVEGGRPAPMGLFARIVALDIDSGVELDTFEPEDYVFGGFTPAYSNIVFGKVKGLRKTGIRRGLPKSIVAYNWLEVRSE